MIIYMYVDTRIRFLSICFENGNINIENQWDMLNLLHKINIEIVIWKGDTSPFHINPYVLYYSINFVCLIEMIIE